MNFQQHAISAAQRTRDLITAGKIEEAIRFSGEETAVLDAEWTRLYNTGDTDCDRALIAAGLVACRHVEALMEGDEAVEAYSTAAMLLYRSTMTRTRPFRFAQSQLDILCRLLTAAMAVGDVRGYMSASADARSVDHFAHIISYIASMLYFYYKEVGNALPDSPLLEEAYSLLEQMQEIGAIQYPTIRVNTRDVEANDIIHILPDLFGRSRALGMLNVN